MIIIYQWYVSYPVFCGYLWSPIKWPSVERQASLDRQSVTEGVVCVLFLQDLYSSPENLEWHHGNIPKINLIISFIFILWYKNQGIDLIRYIRKKWDIRAIISVRKLCAFISSIVMWERVWRAYQHCWHRVNVKQ